MQVLTTRVPQKLLHRPLNHANVSIVMELAMSIHFQCESGSVVNVSTVIQSQHLYRALVINVQCMFSSPRHRTRFHLTRDLFRLGTAINEYFDVELVIHVNRPNCWEVVKVDVWELLEQGNHDSRHAIKTYHGFLRHTSLDTTG